VTDIQRNCLYTW